MPAFAGMTILLPSTYFLKTCSQAERRGQTCLHMTEAQNMLYLRAIDALKKTNS